MNYLRIRFTPKRPRRIDKKQTKADRWGSICISVTASTGKEIRKLIDTQWAYNELGTWLIENHRSLLEDRVPTGEGSSSSIAEAVARFYAELDPDAKPDTLIERMYDYRASHGLRFGMRGTDIPDIYMGLFNKGYEVSFCTEDEKWKYNVDLPAFLQEASRLLEGLK